MKGTILLNATENTRHVEEEEKSLFVRSILETMGVPIDNIWDDNGDLSLANKIKLRSLLASYSVMIIDNVGGELQIFVEEEGKEPTLVGQWFKPTYTLKKDLNQFDPRKKLYLEAHINYWSVFENTE